MPDRIVVLRSEEPRRFLAEVCAALAAEVNEPHAWSVADDQLMAVYAETVMALARLRREELEGLPGNEVQLAVIDHLIERVRQSRAGEIGFRLADVVDRLHAEAVSELIGS